MMMLLFLLMLMRFEHKFQAEVVARSSSLILVNIEQVVLVHVGQLNVL